MSFGLGKGRILDAAPGSIGLTSEELGPLPGPGEPRADPRAWFEHPEHPLHIEIGSGKGTFLLQQAAAEPAANFLGIEWAGEFYRYAADRCRRAGLRNVRLLNADATEFLRWRCPDSCVRVIHLYFSDPWPKTRHHKRRVVQDAFLADAHRVLTPGGELRIVTDHDEYWAWMLEHFARATRPEAPARFEQLPFAPTAAAGAGELVGTNFERKYKREGRPFNAAVLRRIP